MICCYNCKHFDLVMETCMAYACREYSKWESIFEKERDEGVKDDEETEA